MDKPARAPFIALDGPDGCGKSTQAGLLAQWLRESGFEVRVVRDPGGTPVGEAVRSIILDRRFPDMALETELLLYMASRAELVKRVVAPALDRGEAVVADRFLSSSVVYQGIAGGLPLDSLLLIGRFATAGLLPDLTVILDLPAASGLGRKTAVPDRIESRSLEYHEKVRMGFLNLASVLPGTVRVVDASAPVGEVSAAVRSAAAEVTHVGGA